MILVTGGSGFLGRHLLHYLDQIADLPIRATYRSGDEAVLKRAYPAVEWVRCDLQDVFALENAFAGITQVYHCAATVSFSTKQRAQTIANNVKTTANVVNQALESNIGKMVHVSSVAALGREEPGITVTETTNWHRSGNNSAYSESKNGAEMEVWRGIAEGLNAVIVNPGIILGAGDWRKGSAHLIAVVDKGLPWYTRGINGWVDVRDVAIAMVQLMESNIHSERFILSAGNFSYKDVFAEMAAQLGKKPAHKYAGPLISGILWRLMAIKTLLTGKESTITRETAHSANARYIYDNSKFLNRFPDFHYHTLQETIAEMVRAYEKSR